MVEILLSQRFLPELGGSITWMYEAYRRWPSEVRVITHNYYDRPEFNSRACLDLPQAPNLHLERADIYLKSWGLDSPGNLLRYARMTWLVAKHLRSSGSVRVHCTHAVPEASSLIPLKLIYGKRIEIISYAHAEEIKAVETSRQLRWLYRQTCRHVSHMITNTKFTANLVSPYLPPEKITVVHPGVDIDCLRQGLKESRKYREQEELNENDLMLLTVGRLEKRKNQISVIKALHKLLKSFPNLYYYIVGAGPEEERLKSAVKELGIEKNVKFKGEVGEDEKRVLFAACDIFIMPSISSASDTEGFGIVFLEAGACGKPSIAGKSGGQPEAVLDRHSGLIVDGSSIDEIQNALQQLAADASLRADLGKNAYARAKEHTWPKVVQRTLDAL